MTSAPGSLETRKEVVVVDVLDLLSFCTVKVAELEIAAGLHCPVTIQRYLYRCIDCVTPVRVSVLVFAPIILPLLLVRFTHVAPFAEDNCCHW